MKFTVLQMVTEPTKYFILQYKGVHDKGSGDVVSAVCRQRDRYEYVVYIF